MNLASIVNRHDPDTVALVSRGKPTTYGTLREQIAGLRGALVAAGLEPGDRVVILSANNRYFVVSYLAVLGAGLIAVPVNPAAPSLELESELKTVGARAALVGPAAFDAISGIDRANLPDLELVIGCGFEIDAGLDFDTMITHEPVDIVERDDDDIAVMVFTSGTAGSPKAAMLTHGNLRSNIAQTLGVPGGGQTADDVVLGVLPMFHIFGLNVMLGVTMAVGGSAVLIERFDPQSVVEAIARHGVTVAAGPPTMWSAFLGLYDLPADSFSSIRMAVSGAARMPETAAEQFLQRFGVRIYEGYGLTEAAPVVTASVGTAAPIGSVGRPVPGLEVRLVDEGGDDVLVGDAGEVWLRGPNVFAGYYQNPDATAQTINSDGWLLTGDVGTVDDDGFLYLVDRVKDLIIVSGFNVYPAEVEDALMSHPAIDACAVVGVPHPYTGEAVKAYVVTVKGVAVEEDDIIAHCALRLARYKCPQKVWFVDDVPQGMGGKVLRRALR